MAFYTFSQNNSGGSFVENENVAEYVIIEAANASEANERAEGVGIYFNGCDDGSDCPCCGDRWYPTSDYDKEDFPSLYGKSLDQYVEGVESGKEKVRYLKGCIVYFASGEKMQVGFKGVPKEKKVKSFIKLNGKPVKMDKILDRLTHPNPAPPAPPVAVKLAGTKKRRKKRK